MVKFFQSLEHAVTINTPVKVQRILLREISRFVDYFREHIVFLIFLKGSFGFDKWELNISTVKCAE